MRVFAIGDLHLEGGSGKTMDRFGEHWRDHDRKIFDSWELLGRDDDVLLLAGDISWAMRFEDAHPDLNRIATMKGRKIMVKGNHDFWWPSLAKLTRFLGPTVTALQANSTIVDRLAVVGTRGWLCPADDNFTGQDHKIYEREVGRLRHALAPLETRKDEFDSLIVMLHYPPTNSRHEPSGFTELIDESGADACVYGHLHGADIEGALTGRRGRANYYLVSADAARFAPVEIELDRPRRIE